MLAKLSVDQALMKAKSHAKKGEVVQAEELYQGILHKFSQNRRAQQGLADLNKIRHLDSVQDSPQQQANQLINLYKAGKFSLVVEQAQVLTKQYPKTFIFWNILGASTLQLGLLDEAITVFKKAISIKPNDAEAYSNLGNAFRLKGKFSESIDTCKKALELNPNNIHANFNMANTLKDLDKFDEAIKAYEKVIFINPDYYLAYNNMGNALKDSGKLDDAILAYKKAISLKLNYYVAYYNMGNVLESQEKFDQAIIAYDNAISINSDYAGSYTNKGNILKDQGKFDQATKAYKKALSLEPDHFNINLYMALVLQDQGKIEEAIDLFRKSISLNPNFVDTHLYLSLTLLQSGQIKAGLEEYEWRHKTEKGLSRQRQFSKPIWDGQVSLENKKLLLWCEQGIGDTMNWSSCLPLLASRAKHVILECQEKLVPLLSRSFPNVEIRAEDRSSDAKRDDFDLHLPMGSLYKHFIDEIIENDMAESYLVPDPKRVQFWKDRLSSVGKGPYIGLCWKSSDKSAYRLQHYPPICDWSPVLKIPDVTFINLQYTDYEDDLVKVQDEFGVTIHNFEDIDQYGDIDEVAALCGALDVVIATKVTPAMISAGVGTLTKVANWRQSDFNNILNNPQSTSLEMIHRETSEPWDNVFNLIADDL